MSEALRTELDENRYGIIPFDIDNDEKAERALELRKQCQQEIEKWKAHYDRLFDIIKKEQEYNISQIDAKLQAFFKIQEMDGNVRAAKKSASYSLPSGKLILKRQDPEYKPDSDTLVPWLEEHNLTQFVKVKKTANWEDFKKTVSTIGTDIVTDDGEIVPGIAVTLRDDKFVVEVK